jgi:hypothetical protein
MAIVMSASLPSLRPPVTHPKSANCGTPLLVAVLALVSPHRQFVIVVGLRDANNPDAILIESRPTNSELGEAISRTDLVSPSLCLRPDRLVG